jgi:hypothetical protein
MDWFTVCITAQLVYALYLSTFKTKLSTMNIQKITIAATICLSTLANISCNEAAKETETSTTITETPDSIPRPDVTTMQPTMNCYSGHIGKDSFHLRVEQFPTVVTGSLTYDFFEKDKNEGDLDGKISGDTLLANYTFSSEGKISTRQVIFLLKDSVATEGYGEMRDKEGKMVFKDLRSVNFSGPKLKNVPCHSL